MTRDHLSARRFPHPFTTVGRALIAAALALAAAACTDYERLAHDDLTAGGFVGIQLTSKGKGTFSFTAKKDGQSCTGTITIAKTSTGKNSGKSTTCRPDAAAPTGAAPRGTVCSQKTPDVCYREGAAYEKEGAYDKARASYGKGCDFGHPSSCNDLGAAYFFGTATAKDPQKALAYFEKACGLKHGRACNNAGIQYEKLEPPKLDLAFGSFKKACDLGSDEGCTALARSLKNGSVAAADAAAARAAFENACRPSAKAGCVALGVVLARGQGGPADAARAEGILASACDQGVADACKNLGFLLQEGKIEPKDPVRVAGLFETACNLKEGGGCNELGLAAEHGEGIPKNAKRAAALYAEGCKLENSVACSNSGIALRDGLGGTKDPKAAVAAFEKGCSLGDKRACELRAKLP